MKRLAAYIALLFSVVAPTVTAATPDEATWALPRISVACFRNGPAHSAELDSQVLMGMPVRVLGYDGDEWYQVECPDGYVGYVSSPSLTPLDDAEFDRWRRADRLVVTAPYQTRAYTSPEATGLRDVVTDLVLGCIVEGSLDHPVDGRILITLPDGRTGWADASAFATIEDWASQDFNPDLILDTAYSMEGTPYLWGGTSVKSLDCSGLAKVSYLANGIILKRNASQQARTGMRIEASDWPQCEAGDLLFFGTKAGKVTHVAIYDHAGRYVHSSGRVRRNSVDPADPSYLTTPFLHAVRIHGSEGTDGIVRAADHPWYFKTQSDENPLSNK